MPATQTAHTQRQETAHHDVDSELQHYLKQTTSLQRELANIYEQFSQATRHQNHDERITAELRLVRTEHDTAKQHQQVHLQSYETHAQRQATYHETGTTRLQHDAASRFSQATYQYDELIALAQQAPDTAEQRTRDLEPQLQ